MPRMISQNPLDELVPAVTPLSVWEIERRAEKFLEEYQEDMLRRPMPLDVAGLVDYLPQHRISVSPASAEELGPQVEAIATWEQFPEIEILMLEEQWRALFERGEQTHRAHATLPHELAHGVLHAEQLHISETGPKALALRVTKRSNLEAFRDPEWQAWTWAGFVLMPRRILVDLDCLEPEYVSEVYDVSPEMARYHLRLLRRNGMLR